ncbi:hypothetical protein J6590_037115 [Homalodisca vitripennis]|nr:hypothetical protein J6590_037115 [Homalodisca vitripennis]
MEDAYNPGAPKLQEVDLVVLQENLMTTLLTEGKLISYMGIRKGKDQPSDLSPLAYYAKRTNHLVYRRRRTMRKGPAV